MLFATPAEVLGPRHPTSPAKRQVQFCFPPSLRGSHNAAVGQPRRSLRRAVQGRRGSLPEHLQTPRAGPEWTGHTPPGRRVQTEPGRVVGSMVSSPASERSFAGTEQLGQATELRSPDSAGAAGRRPPTTASGSRSAGARHAGRAAVHPQTRCCSASPGVEEPPRRHRGSSVSRPAMVQVAQLSRVYTNCQSGKEPPKSQTPSSDC